MAERCALIEQAKSSKWFHAIDFGDFQTIGRFGPGRPANSTLYGAMDLLQHVDPAGLDCLDIGAADGLVAFNLAMRGAENVTATDKPPDGRPALHLARELLGLDVQIEGGVSFDNIIERLDCRRFDIVVCCGVMYHMLHPFDGVLKCRELLKKDGVLLFQTLYNSKAKSAVLELNSATGTKRKVNTYWLPSHDGLIGMLAMAGFDIMAVRSIVRPDFLAVVARNANFDEIAEAPGIIRDQHAYGIRGIPATIEGPPSPAVYAGPRDEARIDILSYRPDFPPHPAEDKPVIGKPHTGRESRG